MKYSAIGPNVNAGKNANAAKITITAKIINPNVSVSVFKVHALSGIYFLLAKMHAIATGPIVGRYRDTKSMIRGVIFQKGLFTPRSSKTLPLFAQLEATLYNISKKP